MDPSESQFIPNPGLSDKSHNCAHACKVIALNKVFDIFPRAYCLNTLLLPVLTTKAVNKIASRYSCLSFGPADDFFKARVEHEIARLDIIIAQVANRASALKTTLDCIQNHKIKRLEQLVIIAAIKNNNL